ncbi:MAG: DUF2961 domain-containing protein [Tannerella sp.]|jgi:hypothetical protein|nr:DUF2961 domain-containing protein [Tannerella sp.]
MKKSVLMIFLAGSVTLSSCRTEQPEYRVITGLEAMANVERLPYLFPPGTKKNRFISYDPSGGNGFGFFRSTFKRYVDDRGELVLFDAYGPGCLYRQQMNIWIDNGVGKKSETIRIKYYFDHDTVPGVDLPVKEFFRGDHDPVTEPFTMIDKNIRFGICYYPFPFREHLKVTLSDTLITRLLDSNHDDGCNWYQYDYLTYPQGTAVKTWAPGDSKYEATVRKQWNNCGADPKDTAGNEYREQRVALLPNAETVIFESGEKASVSSIDLGITPYSAETFYNTQIRIYWDDSDQPAVDMPVSYFFGGGGPKDGQLKNAMHSLLYGYDSTRLYCYWPMPFREKAKIVIYNKGSETITSLTSRVGYRPASVYDYPGDETAYFRAKLTKDSTEGVWTRKFEKPYVTAFEEEGHGHVVLINMWSGNFLEDGDEFTYIDNRRMPWIHGDGTEDDFNQGWAGFTYDKPLWGALKSGVKGAYRIHMNEPYIFYDHIDIRFEQTGGLYGMPAMLERRRPGTNDSICEAEFVVCYYKSASGRMLELSDSLDTGNPDSEKEHSCKIEGKLWSGELTQSYDSYDTQDDYYVTADDGVSFNKYCEFKTRIHPANDGVRLMARINRKDNGLQTGNIYVDGKKLPAPWHIVTYSGIPRQKSKSFDGWYDCEYEIPSKYTKGKDKITIRIEHLQSLKNELNSFYFWIYSYKIK